MKIQTKYLLYGFGGLFVLFFVVVAPLINKYYHLDIKSHPKMYCYEYIRNTQKPISVLIIEDLELKEPYLRYYKELEQGVEPILHDDIPLKGLPQYKPVYVLEYTPDSLLAEVVCYGTRGLIRGWVYAKTLHEKPPTKVD